ncbi:MAG: hypothetical protein FJ014_18645 [Chloroflexi bacterium]|nr:hypothetical protein [Chloroflexota bacterium]
MAKPGTSKHPAVARVRTMERVGEIMALCDRHGWKVVVGVEPDKPEDISDVERLLNPTTPVTVPSKVGRNDPCPCGSGLKFKNCCLRKYK